MAQFGMSMLALFAALVVALASFSTVAAQAQAPTLAPGPDAGAGFSVPVSFGAVAFSLMASLFALLKQY